jgi:hypothetical protein
MPDINIEGPLVGRAALSRGHRAVTVLLAGRISDLDLFHREELLPLPFRSGRLRLTIGERDLEAMEQVNEKRT